MSPLSPPSAWGSFRCVLSAGSSFLMRFRVSAGVMGGFSGASESKESACSVGDAGSIPGPGRPPWRKERLPTPVLLGFPRGSAGKESACNVGDLGSIHGVGRSPGEGIGYPLQYCWASLVAQLVKNLPVMWETWVPSMGWEDPLEKG